MPPLHKEGIKCNLFLGKCCKICQKTPTETIPKIFKTVKSCSFTYKPPDLKNIKHSSVSNLNLAQPCNVQDMTVVHSRLFDMVLKNLGF